MAFLPTYSQSSRSTCSKTPDHVEWTTRAKSFNGPSLAFHRCQFPSNASLLLLMGILIYNIFPRTWSFMSLLLFSTQLGVVTWFLGMIPLASWVVTHYFLSLVFFLLWVIKHSSTTISTLVSLPSILLNKIVFITKCFILDFSIKNNKNNK